MCSEITESDKIIVNVCYGNEDMEDCFFRAFFEE